MSKQATYPEHEKLSGVSELSQSLGGFLEWLSGNGYQICELSAGRVETWHPVMRSINKWLADYFDIDLVKLEAEKRQMLEQLRKGQDKK